MPVTWPDMVPTTVVSEAIELLAPLATLETAAIEVELLPIAVVFDEVTIWIDDNDVDWLVLVVVAVLIWTCCATTAFETATTELLVLEIAVDCVPFTTAAVEAAVETAVKLGVIDPWNWIRLLTEALRLMIEL